MKRNGMAPELRARRPGRGRTISSPRFARDGSPARCSTCFARSRCPRRHAFLDDRRHRRVSARRRTCTRPATTSSPSSSSTNLKRFVAGQPLREVVDRARGY
jgi:hypothetical protein